MALQDRHDPRQFDHYAKLDADGNVLATIEVAAGAEPPTDAIYVFITDCYPYDFSGVKVRVQKTRQNGQSDPPPMRDAADIRADLRALNKVRRA